MMTSRSEPAQEPDFHGAAIIDEQGREIPITENMIRSAIEQLDRNWQAPYPSQFRGA